MLPATPSFERLALNRVTFGARPSELGEVAEIGWPAWVSQQLDPPAGDEPIVARHLASRTLHIRYAVQLPAGASPGWPAIDETRKLNYLGMPLPAIWEMVSKTEVSVAPNERTRIQQELNAATWIRNTHARYQVREFMADFWNNHFNIGRQEDVYASAALPVFDAEVVRPRALGNFRDLLEAVATSASMLRYLDNAASAANGPTENYVRELLELHTLGRDAYAGVEGFVAPPNVRVGDQRVTERFCDADIVQAARAFSGWTLEHGQDGPDGPLPFTGRFIYNPLQHSQRAGVFMGVDLAPYTAPMSQGRLVLDIVANHPMTAEFVCGKLCRRIFGDNPPQAVVTKAIESWLANRSQPDQIKRVVEVILRDPAIGQPPSKLRRPYEKLMAFFRVTEVIINGYDQAYMALSALGDGVFAWPTPEGRPDHDAHWLSRTANLEYWNLLFKLLQHPAFLTNFTNQMPADARGSAESVVEFWVGRMIGHRLRPEGMRALIDDAMGPIGAMAAFRSKGASNIENALRRLATFIAISPEFAMR